MFKINKFDKFIAFLKECEEKKQKEKEEKEKRKVLREQKKKEKEEELRKKKTPAAEKRVALAMKAAVAAAGAVQKKAAAEQKKAATAVRKATVVEKRVSAENVMTFITELEENWIARKWPTSSYYALRDKQARCDSVLDSDAPSCSITATTDSIRSAKDKGKTVWQCSVCFENYDEEDDEVWVQCGCGRWMHEVCISQSDIVINTNGKELFCPYCSIYPTSSIV